MLWGNLETIEQNLVKYLEIEILAIKKALRYFSLSFGIQHMQLENLGSAKKKKYLKFIAYINQSKGDVASRAESKKPQ